MCPREGDSGGRVRLHIGPGEVWAGCLRCLGCRRLGIELCEKGGLYACKLGYMMVDRFDFTSTYS